MIPESKIEEIKQLSDIVEVVSDYVALQAAGSRYKAKSPFKPNERTPSFFVSPDRQIFKCFSTGHGGDVFTFVMLMERMNYIEAVKFLAKRAKIDLSPYERKAPQSEHEITALSIMTWAAKSFHDALQSGEGKIALDYYRSRGLDLQTISHFGLGYSYDAWDWLYKKAEKENLPTPLLKEVGLIAYSEKSEKFYDVFRARAIFPILSSAGKVVAFGGRVLGDNRETAKYINSPETKLYEKSKVLYAFNFAKDTIRKKNEAILVEGYMDVIAMHQAGFTGAVASSGTSLTADQARMLARASKNTLFIYDGDDAGIKAMVRGIDILLENGLTPKILLLPDNHDPDSFIKQYGSAALTEYSQSARKSFLDFRLDLLYRRGGFETPSQSAESVHQLLELLIKIPDDITQSFYLKDLSEKTGVSLSSLQRQCDVLKGERKKRYLRSNERSSGSLTHPSSHSTDRHRGDDENQPPAMRQRFSAIPAAERTFLKALIESTQHGSAIIDFVREHTDLFGALHPDIRLALYFLLDHYKDAQLESREDHFDIITELNQVSESELRDYITGLMVEQPISERWPNEPPHIAAKRCLREFLDAGKALLLIQYDERIADKRKQIEHASDQTHSGSETTEAYLRELTFLIRQRHEAEVKFKSALEPLIR